MANATKSDERSYRRGLILGLTMAEVFVLLLFALLLVWAIGTRKQQQDSRRVQELNNRVRELQEEVAYLAPSPRPRNNFDDLFRELKLSQEEAASLRKPAQLLTELGERAGISEGPPERIAERIREYILIAQQATEAARRTSLSRNTPTAEQLARKLADLAEVQGALQKAGLSPDEAGALGRSAQLLRELGRQAGVPDAPPEQAADRIRQQLRIGRQLIDAAKSSPLSKGTASSEEVAESLAGLAETQTSLQQAALSPSEAATLGRSARLLRELGKEVGAPDASPEEIAEIARRQIAVARQLAVAAEGTPLSQGAPTSQQLTQKVASLAEVQEALQRAGLRPSEAAELAHSAQLLRDLGKEAGFPDGSPERMAEGVGKQIEIAQRVLDAARVLSGSASLTDAQVAESVRGLLSLQNELNKAGLGADEAATFIAQSQEQIREKNNSLRSLQGRLKYAESQLKTLGRGTEKPACWADPETGKPEYIFDVALESAGLTVRDNALPQRREEEDKLPIHKITFGEHVTVQRFRHETIALFLWSEKEGCRFFVRVFDLTAAHEKDRYKFHLRVVGEHFYYYEELSRPWRKEDESKPPR